MDFRLFPVLVAILCLAPHSGATTTVKETSTATVSATSTSADTATSTDTAAPADTETATPTLTETATSTSTVSSTSTTVVPYTRPPYNSTLRSKLMTAAGVLANVLHKRFHKNQTFVLYAETDIDTKFVFNPVEISCTLGVLMSGMGNEEDYQELSELLGFRRAQFSNVDMFKAMEEYLHNEQYKTSRATARKVYLSTGIFTNQHFTLLDTFNRTVQNMFRGDLYDLSEYGNETKVRRFQNYVSNKTSGFLDSPPKIDINFPLMIVGVTYIRDAWLDPLVPSDQPLILNCVLGNEKSTLQTNTRDIWTWYVDQKDRFGIMVPFKRAELSIYYYVPKTQELFDELDGDMNYKIMEHMLDLMLNEEMVHLKVTFPLIEMSYSRNLTYDMEVVGVRSIFLADAVKYENMTRERDLVVSQVYHDSVVKMTEKGLNFASTTFLAVQKRSSSLTREDHAVLQDMILENRTSDYERQVEQIEPTERSGESDGHDLFVGRSNKRKEVGGKRMSPRERPFASSTTHPEIQRPFFRNSKIFENSSAKKKKEGAKRKCKCKKKKRKHCKPKVKPNKCRKAKLLNLLLRREAFATESAAPYYEPGSTVKPERKGKIGQHPLPNDRKNKALFLDWGLERPRITWTGPRATTQGYTFPKEQVKDVVIKTSFFYAIVNHRSGSLFALGKVARCKEAEN